MDKIKDNRDQINVIDEKVMYLLDKRFQLTNEIGELKKVEKRVVFDPTREQHILDKTTKFSHYPQLKAIYRTIMDESKSLQRK